MIQMSTTTLTSLVVMIGQMPNAPCIDGNYVDFVQASKHSLETGATRADIVQSLLCILHANGQTMDAIDADGIVSIADKKSLRSQRERQARIRNGTLNALCQIVGSDVERVALMLQIIEDPETRNILRSAARDILVVFCDANCRKELRWRSRARQDWPPAMATIYVAALVQMGDCQTLGLLRDVQAEGIEHERLREVVEGYWTDALRLVCDEGVWHDYLSSAAFEINPGWVVDVMLRKGVGAGEMAEVLRPIFERDDLAALGGVAVLSLIEAADRWNLIDERTVVELAKRGRIRYSPRPDRVPRSWPAWASIVNEKAFETKWKVPHHR